MGFEFAGLRILFVDITRTRALNLQLSALLIAKKLCKSAAESDSRQILFNHFVKNGGLDITTQNQDGQNIMSEIMFFFDLCKIL